MKRAGVWACAIAVLALAPARHRQPAYPEPHDFQTLYIALLTKGPAWTAESTADARKTQNDHLAHLSRLSVAGSLLIAGPIDDDGDLRGVCVLKAKSLDEAKALEQDDPSVKAGRLRVDVLTVSIAANWFTLAPVKQDMSIRQFAFGLLSSSAAAEHTAQPDSGGQTAHLSYLWSMRQSGALVLEGTISDDGVRRELVVLAVDAIAKAKTLTELDPAVKNGQFIVTLHPWFAADGVMQAAK